MANAESPPDLAIVPGTLVAGKHRVVRALAAGGVGEVFLVEHEVLGHRAALKVLRSEVAQRPGARERFLREARIAASLRSDHAVRVFDVGSLEDDRPYMLMEYLEGRDLAVELTQQGKLLWSDAVEVILQAIDAIAEAHDRGVIHRDLKPSNLFLADKPGGRIVKVLDFGISKIVPGDTPGRELTAANAILGSPAYMSPDQAKSPHDVDARTDIWSLGAVLHELVAGRPAFDGETEGAILARVLTEDPPAPSRLVPDLPPAFDAVVARCLARDREDRYPHVAALRDALLAFASGTRAPLLASPSAESSPAAIAPPAVAPPAGVPSSLVFDQTSSGVVAVFGNGPVDDREWDEYLAVIERRVANGAAARALVISGSTAPSPAQRARLELAFAPVRDELKVAIVTSSTFVRGVVSAFALFMPGYRAFGTNALDDAIAYLDAHGRDAADLRAAVMRLRARQGAR